MNHYHSSSTWIYNCTYHLIFTTKYRRKVLTIPIQNRCKEILLSLQSDKFKILELEIMEDHVHILFSSHPDFDLKKLVYMIKGKTSNILRSEFPELVRRLPSLWTRSKFITTVGSVKLDVIKQYIQNQKNK